MFAALARADNIIDAKNSTTTTIKPKSTTIPSIITTPKPSLPEQPHVGNWNVTDKNEKFICVLLNAGIRFTFQYVNAKNVVSLRASYSPFLLFSLVAPGAHDM